MSRLSKLLLLITLIVFILACNTVTKPFKDVQNVANTAESFASAMPLETLQSLATNIPVQTLEALPSSMPDFEGMFNPQGEPVAEWNGIPIMSQATAGQEFTDSKTYSFKANVTVKEASDFYTDALVKLGWSSTMSIPGDNNSAVLVYSKGSNFLNVTITAQGDATLVLLTLA